MDELRPVDDSEETNPSHLLERAYEEAASAIGASFISDRTLQESIELVAQGRGNKSCVRALMACCLAKISIPSVDIRKPYTKIAADDTYSGRDFDERYIGPFAIKHELPCNETTAFLTPAFRNRNVVLTPEVDLVGRPPGLYRAFLFILDQISKKAVSAERVLRETIRLLVGYREEHRRKIDELLNNLRREASENTLAAEAIVKLIEHHLSMSGTSRLPVLIVAAAYQVAERNLGERVLPLEAHNAADKQTGALGDLQIVLTDDSNVVTAYEMKTRPVAVNDIDLALAKIDQHPDIDNYIFITTQPVLPTVQEYASQMYARTGGVEIAVLDCVGFMRHFLHLFYRLRGAFLDAYQSLVLSESESAVGQHVKEALLHLRTAAEKANVTE